jgi:hypothetical protein
MYNKTVQIEACVSVGGEAARYLRDVGRRAGMVGHTILLGHGCVRAGPPLDRAAFERVEHILKYHDEKFHTSNSQLLQVVYLKRTESKSKFARVRHICMTSSRDKLKIL